MIIGLPLRVVYVIIRPLTWLIGKISSMVMRMIGIDPNADEQVHSEEELKMIIAESQE
jgi:Mg2+/Co2+ transporter CorB